MSSNQQSASNINITDQYPVVQRKSIEHLKTYPVIKTGLDWFYYIPFTKQTKVVLTPTFRIIGNTQPIKFVYDVGDLYLDNALTRFDNCMLRLQSTEVTNRIGYLSRPVKGTIDTIDRTVRSTDEKIMKQVVEPTIKTMNAVVDSISKPSRSNSTTNNGVDLSKNNEKSKPPVDSEETNTTLTTKEDRKSIKESVNAVISSLSGK